MKLICYLHPGWAPMLRPAEATRAWMTDTPESFAYRCLPLNIANAHGWEVLNPCSFDAIWTGGPGIDAVQFRLPAGADPATAPVSLFGQGVLTFHIQGLFRTDPGWNLWVGGSPNHFKDSIQALTGVVETDWSPFSFTMNWRFTRPGAWARFDVDEPICFFFPISRGYLDDIQPELVSLAENPELMAEFKAWTEARYAFQEKARTASSGAPADKWQKHYYRGVKVDEAPGPADHKSKLRLKAFRRR